jgi:hypothetical protein
MLGDPIILPHRSISKTPADGAALLSTRRRVLDDACVLPALQRELGRKKMLATAQTNPNRRRRTAGSLLSKDEAMYRTGAVFQPELITLMKTVLERRRQCFLKQSARQQ